MEFLRDEACQARPLGWISSEAAARCSIIRLTGPATARTRAG
jgi:hypothetical protein